MTASRNGEITAKIDTVGEVSARILSAYVSHNTVSPKDLPELVSRVIEVVSNAGRKRVVLPPQEPAVPVAKSVFDDYIICLEDGKKMKMLKRHLRTNFGMTPDAYRTKWGLPDSYPMVAPAYAARRSTLAQEMGLGRTIKARSENSIPETEQVKTTFLSQKKRGRPPKPKSR